MLCCRYLIGKSIVKPEILPINFGGLIGPLNGKSPIDCQKSVLKPELLRIYFQEKSVLKPECLPIYFQEEKSMLKPELLLIYF